MMQIGIITLFPELFEALSFGIIRKAIANKLVSFSFFNPRDFADNKHHRVDDRPYGGGPGMVMSPQPLASCIEAAKLRFPSDTALIYLSPQGQTFNQHCADTASQRASLLLLCGRYEGIDERIIDEYVDEEWSVGDYVLSGGEYAALTIIDAIVRLRPGALGDENSATQDSFTMGLLDYPHYTRPEIFHGRSVPPALMCGNHAHIAEWRAAQSLARTRARRPDLLPEDDVP